MSKSDSKPRGFVFFPQDYFGDKIVRLMPGYLRIVWVEAFLLMSDSPRRGVLLKPNGQPYKITELSTIMNLSVEHIQEALEYVVREEISGVDRRSKQITSRKMIREELKRKTASLNGKKGGNPSLVKKTNTKDLQGQVNQPDILARAITDPEPDPEPVSSPIKNIHSLEDSPPNPAPPEKRGARPRDLAMDCFTEKHLASTGVVYQITKADGVQLAGLRERNNVPARASPELWEQAVENYFASPLKKYTLNHLSSDFATFRNSRLNEYGKPVNHQNAGGQHGESQIQQRARRTDEAANRVRDRLLAEAGTRKGDRTG